MKKDKHVFVWVVEDKYFSRDKNMFCHDDMSVPDNFFSQLDILRLAIF